MYEQRVLVIGGIWDDEGGRPSDFLDQVYQSVISIVNPELVRIINGGHINKLEEVLDDSTDRIIISYINFDTTKHRHLSIRNYNKTAAIYSFRRCHSQTINDFRNYLMYSKNDGIIELLEYIDDVYMTRLISSTGVVVSDYTDNLQTTVNSIINEAVAKLNYGRVKYYRQDTHYSNNIDLNDIELINKLLSKVTSSYETVVRSSVNPKHAVFYNKKVDSISVITSYNPSRRILKFSGQHKSPSGSAFIYKYLMDTYPEIQSITRTWLYYTNGVTSTTSPIINSYSTLFVLDNTYVEGNCIINIPGQGSYIISVDRDDSIKLGDLLNKDKVLDNVGAPAYYTTDELVDNYPMYEYHKSNLLIEVDALQGKVVTTPSEYDSINDPLLKFRVL